VLALFQTFRGMRTLPEYVNRGIATIAPLTFAVYLIHEQDVLRPILWNWLEPTAYAQSPWMVLYVLLCMAGIFTACCGIEFLRRKLFRVCGVDKLIGTLCDGVQGRVQRWLSDED
jgi:hypothetical protein